MQNNTSKLLAILGLSAAFVIQPAFAQDAKDQSVEKTVESQSLDQNKKTASTSEASVEQASEVQVLEEKTPEVQTPETQENSPSEDEIQRKKKKTAVDNLIGDNVAINTDKIVDFPGRASLGSIEMATLPGINETLITGPAPMGESLSSKDMPSEQLLGRITTEVFQEMADLERGNVFLNLQKQKEELKNSLESLKAKYRQARLEEIAKREDVVRSRINWWQEQENIRIEMERKKAETEAIEQQIAEAEELREKLRNEALAERANIAKELAQTSHIEPVVQTDLRNSSQIDSEEESDNEPLQNIQEPSTPVQAASELYSLVGVRGLKGRLTARLENKEDQSVISVKKGQRLKTGHKVIRIDRDTIQLSYAGRIEVIVLNTAKQASLD